MSGLKQFDFQSIDQIDNGSLVVALNNAIHQAYLDCESRPALGKPRDVTLKVSLKPIKVFAEPEQRSKCLPVRRSAEAHPVALIA
jgi:hypothetical protein